MSEQVRGTAEPSEVFAEEHADALLDIKPTDTSNNEENPCSAKVANLGFAQLDLEREERTGVAEVVYGAGKTAEQIAGIVAALCKAGQKRVLITRLDEQKAEELRACGCNFAYYKQACAGVVGGMPQPDGNGEILILTAGTSDLPVAKEAAVTAPFWATTCAVFTMWEWRVFIACLPIAMTLQRHR